MTNTTRIECAHKKIAGVSDASDLAEMLLPGNRNQQHAFLVIWFTLKWDRDGRVPTLGEEITEQGVSRRTLERVRAKLRRLGLIERVSRFSARHGYRDGWAFSSRFENGLRQLADKVAAAREPSRQAIEKDELFIHLAAARRDAGHAATSGQQSGRHPPPHKR